jgi:hypothetical protein
MAIRRSILGGLILGLLLAGRSVPAFAMDASSKEAVRRLANDGASAFDAGQYEQALGKFQLAYDTARVPTLALCVAQTQAKLGHLVAALESYRQALNLEASELWVGTLQEQAQHQAQQELALLQERIPRLTIRIEGAESKDVAVEIDGVVVPSALVGMERFVDPGKRQVVGKSGGLVVREEPVLAEAERKQLVLKFAANAPVAAPSQHNSSSGRVLLPAAQERSSSSGQQQRTWGWVSLGVGAAGLAVGATTGILVALKYGKLNEDCPNRECTQENWPASNSYATMRTVSTVGFVVGAVGTAVGLTLLLTSPKEQSSGNVGLWVAPASVGVRGSF